MNRLLSTPLATSALIFGVLLSETALAQTLEHETNSAGG